MARANSRKSGSWRGVAYDLYGSLHGSMGVDCGDFDNDGLLDFYQTSLPGPDNGTVS